MKNFLEFLPWFWRNSDTTDKYMAFLGLFIVAIALSSALYGFAGFFIAVGITGAILLLLIVIAAFLQVYRYVNSKWEDYNLYKLQEADRIIQRLKGE